MTVLSCPSQRQLLDFLLGRLNDDQARAVEDHIPGCPACQAAVARLDAVQDPLLRRLRQASESDPLLIEQELQQLLPRTEHMTPPAGHATVDKPRPPAPERPAPSGDLRPGSSLGRYRIVAKLGQGGMGAVYKAHDPQLHRAVAVKVPHFDRRRPDHGTAVQRFLREARLAASVRHAHVCPVHDVGEHDGSSFVVMAFIEGESLADLIKHDRPDVSRAVELVRKVALGLEAVHAQGLVHRDLKPANILIDGAGEPLLTDFGVARPVADEERLTGEGVVIGTPAFMAPEQAGNEPAKVGPWTDVYSLGVVLYRLLTGKLPFDGPPLAVLYKIENESPPAPTTLRPEADAVLEAIVLKAMAKKPEARYRSARELAEALAAWSETRTRPDRPVGVPALAGSKPRRRVAIAAAALLALLPLAWFFGGTVIRFATDRGELVVDVDDKDVAIRIVQNGVVVQDRTSKREFTLPAGKGEIEIWEKDGTKLATKPFELTRGGQTTVTVTLQELADARKSQPDPQPEPAAPARETDSDREAARYVLSVGGWIYVRVKDAEQKVHNAAELPKEPFQLTSAFIRDDHQVTDAGLAHFQGCKNLISLFLGGTKVTDAGLAHFQDCKNLMSLDLQNTPVTDDGVAHFRHCKDLTDLDLHGTGVTDVGLAYFRDCKNLRSLNLAGTGVADAGLAHFQDCKSLISLVLGGTKVTDTGLAHFKDCKNLAYLYLGGTGVTDRGLAYFRECKHLDSLDLSGTGVTDEGLALFQDCKSLAKIWLRDTKASARGVDELRKALPGCEIQFGPAPP
jgi:anti-sigma factor RsiW